MAEKTFRHWRSMTDLTYLRAELFLPKEKKILTIKDIKEEIVKNSQGMSARKPVAYFEEDVLPMVLNTTNSKTIEKLYGTGLVERWIGKKIQVFATTIRVGGEETLVLRVEKVIPPSQTNEVVYLCSVCGKQISKQNYDASINKYGKPYCSAECLKVDKEGEQLLK